MKKIKCCILITSMLFLSSCIKKKTVFIRFKNSSPKTVYWSSQINNADTLPEARIDFGRVNPHDTQFHDFFVDDLKKKSDNLIQIFIFNKDTFEKYGVEVVTAEYKVLKRIELNYYNNKKSKTYDVEYK